MDGGTENDEWIGRRLFDAGWRQGTTFRPAGIELQFVTYRDDSGNEPLRRRPLAESEGLILISQDCDLVAKTSTEPFVEALILRVEESDARRFEIERNSAREFVVDPAAKLVADARRRMQLDKALLARFEPEPWPSDSGRFRRFVIWLGRRYWRPAVPDEVVESFQRPVDEVLRRLRRRQPDLVAALTSAVSEIRISYPNELQLPVELNVVMMVRADGVSIEELEAIQQVEQAIRARVDPERVQLGPFDLRTEQEMSIAEYFATVPLFFDYLTYRGDDVVGLEPPSPA